MRALIPVGMHAMSWENQLLMVEKKKGRTGMCMEEVIVKTRIGVKETNLDWRKKTTTSTS